MSEKNVFNRNLREVRNKLGVSQKDFAEMLDVGQSYLSRVERGVHSPSIEQALKMADSLGVPIESLLREESEGAIGPRSSETIGKFLQKAGKANPRLIFLLHRAGSLLEKIPDKNWEFGIKSLVSAMEFMLEPLNDTEDEQED